MHLGLDKKVVLVTGGTRGIGRAIVEGFLEEGAVVYFCSRTAASVEAANERLAKQFPQGQAVGKAVDVADKTQLNDWISSCAEKSGRLDVVVPNVSSFHSHDQPDHWQTMFDVDVMGTWHMVHTALPHLEKTKGNIVFISSVSGRDIDFTAPGPYGAMKAALNHYTQQLANRLAPKGVRVNIVSPGNTFAEGGPFDQIQKQLPELYDSQLKLNPMGRLGTPEEIANAVVFLASERASFVSGANFVRRFCEILRHRLTRLQLVDGALCTGVQY